MTEKSKSGHYDPNNLNNRQFEGLCLQCPKANATKLQVNRAPGLSERPLPRPLKGSNKPPILDSSTPMVWIMEELAGSATS